MKNTFNKLQQQQSNPNQKRSFKSQRKLERRKKTEGQYNPINGIEDFDKKVSEYLIIIFKVTSESVLTFTITPRRPVNNSSPEKNKAKYKKRKLHIR